MKAITTPDISEARRGRDKLNQLTRRDQPNRESFKIALRLDMTDDA